MNGTLFRTDDHLERPHWYVVRTKAQQEDRAESNLRAWGLETFSPRVREVRARGASPATWESMPLFPRYLFARFALAPLVNKVRNTRGVDNVVGLGECATPLDDSVVELIRSRVQPDGFVRVAEPKAGDVVEIVSGPLRSLVGVFEREMRDSDRVMILLTTIGSAARVQVPKGLIRKASRQVAAMVRS